MYYFKQSIFLFVYLLTTSIASLLLLVIPTVWIRFALAILLLAIYLVVVFVAMKQEGEKALKKRHANDLTRKRMITTGQVVEFDNVGEYAIYKGFLIGLFSNMPMLLLLLIHSIIFICGSSFITFGTISSVVYSIYTAPIISLTSNQFTMATHYITLYGAVLSTLISGVGYILGGRKLQLQYDRIEEKQKSIYGEN